MTVTWRDRRRADWRLFRHALWVIAHSAWLIALALGVAAVFAFRLLTLWHAQPSEWLRFRWHGNYCGPGHHGNGLPPQTILDQGCACHDASYGSGIHEPNES